MSAVDDSVVEALHAQFDREKEKIKRASEARRDRQPVAEAPAGPPAEGRAGPVPPPARWPPSWRSRPRWLRPSRHRHRRQRWRRRGDIRRDPASSRGPAAPAPKAVPPRPRPRRRSRQSRRRARPIGPWWRRFRPNRPPHSAGRRNPLSPPAPRAARPAGAPRPPLGARPGGPRPGGPVPGATPGPAAASSDPRTPRRAFPNPAPEKPVAAAARTSGRRRASIRGRSAKACARPCTWSMAARRQSSTSARP